MEIDENVDFNIINPHRFDFKNLKKTVLSWLESEKHQEVFSLKQKSRNVRIELFNEMARLTKPSFHAFTPNMA